MVINTNMITETAKLEKQLKEQAKQIHSLKKVVSSLQQTIMVLSKKTNRTYETGRKNSNDINSLNRILRNNG